MSNGRTGCDGFRRLGATRREVFRAGALALTGLGLPSLFAGRAAAQARPGASSGAGAGPVQYHEDSGVRFDGAGRPVAAEAGGSGSGAAPRDEAPPADVPPQYSET